MSVEVVPTVACNLSCSYCYQDPMRLAGNFGKGRIQLDKVLSSIEKANKGAKNPDFTIFGGEPLLLPRLTLERLWGFGLERYGKNGIQSNGELIDDDFIRLFVKYRVNVGLSVDGPWPLNTARSTEEGTNRTLNNVEKLLSVGIKPSLHVILNRHNASGERLPILCGWLNEVEEKFSEIRIHLMEVDTSKAKEIELTPEENETAFLTLSRLELACTLSPFEDMRRLLRGEFDHVGCTWSGCDPYTTPAVQGVDGDGTLSNCGRTNKDGVAYRKATSSGSERVLSLHVTSFEAGGCKGCRYFFACKGQCPGEGIDGDWRNRSTHCQAYYKVFRELEGRLGVLDDELISKYERQVLHRSGGGGGGHIDTHGDSPHGDAPHTDRYVVRVPVIQ